MERKKSPISPGRGPGTIAGILLDKIKNRLNKWDPRKKEFHINFAMLLLRGDTYLEIGVRDGDCMRQIRAKRKIGIDPSSSRFSAKLPIGSYFEMESDRFFSERAPMVLDKRSIDVALVDGLHEFRQVMRDLANLEPYMSRSGVIFIHDCNPATREQSERETDGKWNGDVWKAAHYLARLSTDLSFHTLDCDHGLGVLQGFGDSHNGLIPSPYDLDTLESLDYEALEKDRRQVLNLKHWHYPFFALPLARYHRNR